MSDDRPDLAPLEAIAREVAAEWGVELGEPFALARYSFVAPAGERRGAEGDAAGGRRDRRGGGRARALGGRRSRAAAAARPRPAGTADRACAAGRRHRGAARSDDATAIAVDVARACGGRRTRRSARHRRLRSALARECGGAPACAACGASCTPAGRAAARPSSTATSTITTSSAPPRGPLAIDPKPMLGEPEYDVPSFLWNPIPYRMRLERDGSAARCVRSRRPRRGADAEVDGDPRRVPRSRTRTRSRCYARSSRNGCSCSQRCSIVVVRAGWRGSYGT